MSRVSISNVALLGLFVVVACGTPDAPQDVARDFWEAIRVGDRERAASLVADSSLRSLDDGMIPDTIEKILFGEVLRNETAAIVRTSMRTRDADIELSIVFHTHLVLQQDRWKVDLGATQQEVTRATFAAGMKFVGEVIGQGIEEFGEALEQGAAEVRDAVRDAIEELGRTGGETL